MLNGNEFQELVEDLSSPDVSILVATLKTLCQDPVQDERVIPHLETLLNDTKPCVVMLPYRFGEICWLAAKALAAEYNASGFNKSVHLHNAIRPLDTDEIVSIASAAGIQTRSGIDGVLETFVTLRRMGQLPLGDLVLPPKTNNKQSQIENTYVASYDDK